MSDNVNEVLNTAEKTEEAAEAAVEKSVEAAEAVEEKAEEAVEAAEEKAVEAAEAAEEKAEEAVEAAEEKTVEAAEAAEEKSEEAVEAAEEKTVEAAEAAEEKAEEAVEAAEEKTVEAAEAAEEKSVEAAEPAAEEKAEEAAEPAAEEKAEEAAAAEEKPKKKSKAGKVILIILIVLLAILLLLAGSALLTVRAATRDKMPEAPAVSSADMSEFLLEAGNEVLTENTITVDADQFNLILDQAKDAVNGSVEGIEVKELFCELADGKGTIYGRVYVEEVPVNDKKVKVDKTFPVQLHFDVDFEAPEIAFIPEKLMCGTINVPMSYISTALDSAELPENVRTENGVIYYDTSELDAQIDQMIADKVNDSIKESDAIAAIGSLFGGSGADELSDLLTEYTTSLISDATDVQIYDADIVGDKIVISAQVA